MSYPLRENLEVYAGSEEPCIRCARCRHVFCRAGEDWKQTAGVRLSPPTKAGPLMSQLCGRYLLQQIYCPSCGILLDTDLVEETRQKRLAEEERPKKPEPRPVAVGTRRTAILVLDLSARCEDPQQPCSAVLPAVGDFLEKARDAGLSVVYTVSASAKGTAHGSVASQLHRRDSEPVIYPDGFDKFTGGELQRILEQARVQTVIILGAATNVAVLYTATTAARIYRYEVVVPVDGVVARTRYAHEYALYQLNVLPGGVSRRVRFTAFPLLSFA